VLDSLGLESALRKLARDSSNGNGIDIDVDTSRGGDRLPARIEAVFYRVAQEAVRNATRHAFPRRVRMSLHRGDSSATLEIHDDGRGFDLVEAERPGCGMGLLCMRERVALVDGWLDIKTAKGNGTTVTATVPLVAGTGDLHLETA
jgi:signal transduction histidine kinase